MKAKVSAYLYNGAHRHFFGVPGQFDTTRLHWDWRYKIVSDSGLTLLQRQGFHNWHSAMQSLERNWLKVRVAVMTEMPVDTVMEMEIGP